MKPNILQRNQYAWMLTTHTSLSESFMCYTEIIRLSQSASMFTSSVLPLSLTDMVVLGITTILSRHMSFQQP